MRDTVNLPECVSRLTPFPQRVCSTIGRPPAELRVSSGNLLREGFVPGCGKFVPGFQL